MPTGEQFNIIAAKNVQTSSKSEKQSREEYDNAFNILSMDDYSNLHDRNYLNLSTSIANLACEFEFPLIIYNLSHEHHLRYLCQIGDL